jgi:hypothetical protein
MIVRQIDMTELNRDFYKDKASKIFGIPYEEVTDDQRAVAKRQLLDYMYDRRLEPPNGILLDISKAPFKHSKMRKMIAQSNVTPLKDLHRRFISDCKNTDTVTGLSKRDYRTGDRQ